VQRNSVSCPGVEFPRVQQVALQFGQRARQGPFARVQIALAKFLISFGCVAVSSFFGVRKACAKNE
jgi:hypothetical protein